MAITGAPTAGRTAPGADLAERAGEVAATGAAIAGAAGGGGGRVVVVEGPAGIGKTALLAVAREQADRAVLRVLTARGDELEREFPFGTARQLLEPVVHPADGPMDPALLAGPARLAGALLDVGSHHGAEPLPVGPDAPLAAVHALFWLVANLSRRAPLAVVVDDAQWADLPSLRLLAYLGRRTAGLPIALVVALRSPPEPSVQPIADALRRAPGVVALRPRPLSPAAGAALVARLAPDAAPPVRLACHAASGGNPFVLRELALALEHGTADEVLAAEPDRVAEAVLGRIGRQSPQATSLVRAVAVLGSDVALRHAAVVAGLPSGEAASAADALAVAGVFQPRRPLEFVHPLMRAAVTARTPAGARAAGHAAAARLLADDDAPPERVAAHLLATEPQGDPWTVRRLVVAARAAMDRAAPEAAVRFLRRALEEPPAREERGTVLLALGAAELLVFDLAAAAQDLRRAIDVAAGPDDRLRGALLLATVLTNDGRAEEAVDVLDAALASGPGGDDRLRVSAEANLVNVARSHPVARRRAQARTRAVLARVDAGVEEAPALLAVAAAELAMAGVDAQRSAALAARALRRVEGAWDALEFWPWVAVRCLSIADRPEAARQVLDPVVERAAARGSLFQLRLLLVFRADAALRAGDVRAAEADARAALTGGGPEAWNGGRPFAVAVLAQALLERGEAAAAAALLREHDLEQPASELTAEHTNHILLLARGRLRVARGDVTAGLDDLLECGRRELDLAEPNPAVLDWRSQAALAHARLGNDDPARRLAAEELELAHGFGARRAIGVAQRAAGLVVGGDDGLALLREAAATLSGSPAALEHARALADLGAALRRRGVRTEAGEVLRRALERAHECGADALEHRALDELHALGARPRRTALSGRDALTPSERRVTDLAAAGHANRDIAAQLHLSIRTVEFHLSGAYRKLGIGSRAELAERG